MRLSLLHSSWQCPQMSARGQRTVGSSRLAMRAHERMVRLSQAPVAGKSPRSGSQRPEVGPCKSRGADRTSPAQSASDQRRVIDVASHRSYRALRSNTASCRSLVGQSNHESPGGFLQASNVSRGRGAARSNWALDSSPSFPDVRISSAAKRLQFVVHHSALDGSGCNSARSTRMRDTNRRPFSTSISYHGRPTCTLVVLGALGADTPSEEAPQWEA